MTVQARTSTAVVLLKAFAILTSTTASHAEKYNLCGKPGDGYYLEALIGTPPQSVSICSYFFIFKRKHILASVCFQTFMIFLNVSLWI